MGARFNRAIPLPVPVFEHSPAGQFVSTNCPAREGETDVNRPFLAESKPRPLHLDKPGEKADLGAERTTRAVFGRLRAVIRGVANYA